MEKLVNIVLVLIIWSIFALGGYKIMRIVDHRSQLVETYSGCHVILNGDTTMILGLSGELLSNEFQLENGTNVTIDNIVVLDNIGKIIHNVKQVNKKEL